MGCELFLSGVAQEIWEDIGSPTSIAITSISGRLISSGFLGQLDALLQECHFIDGSGCISPILAGEEVAIYEEIYKAGYYRKLATQVIGNIGNMASVVMHLREGDSDIVLSDPVNIARMFRDLEKQALDKIKTLATEYKKGLASPQSINFYGLDYGPISYNGGVFAPGPARGFYL